MQYFLEVSNDIFCQEGVVIDPAVFRWYSANAMQYEFFRYTPRSIFLYAGSFIFVFYILVRYMYKVEVSAQMYD